MSDGPIDFEQARIKRDYSIKQFPNVHKVTDALKSVLTDIESGEIDPAHVIVCHFTRGDDGAVQDGFKQSGDATILEQVGLMESVKQLLINSALG